jgi:hypothetical protein
MNKGPLFATLITGATLALIAIGTIFPNASAAKLAGGEKLMRSSTTPEAAVTNLAQEIGLNAYESAYSSLGNKAEFSEPEFRRDLVGDYPSLRTYATLDSFDLRPLHASNTEAEIELRMRWSTVVGTFVDTRDIRVIKRGDRWAPEWPLVKEPRVPPQVIPVNYLRWDVIYRGAGDDWGAQDVEGPHVRIVDMHPVERADGVVVMGELLNEDVVPAFVTVKATLLAKNGSTISSEGSFDKISHQLLPKQVTPFLITFPGVTLSQVGSIRMDPLAELVSASADPIIEVQDQQFNPAPNAALSGQLVNQSGQLVDVAHVLATFYDKNGNLVWVADQYIDRALLPQLPVPFKIPIPPDLARNVSTERTVVATYSSGRFQ